VGDYSDVSRSNYTKITYSTFPDKYHRWRYQKVVSYSVIEPWW
jgi:hypothetical protein